MTPDQYVLHLWYWEIGWAVGRIEEDSSPNKIIHKITRSENTAVEWTHYEVMHVAIVYDPRNPLEYFNAIQSAYEKYKPQTIINHWTVPIGTTGKLRELLNTEAIAYSPVNGMHPDLYPSIKYHFVKYASQKWAVKYLESINISKVEFMDERELEAAKILITTQYGWDILLAKEIKKICDEWNLDYDQAYTQMTKAYNEWYKSLKNDRVIRPVLTPPTGKIGGHCVSQNFELLPDSNLKTMAKILNETNNPHDE